MKMFQCSRCSNRCEVPRGITPVKCHCGGQLKRITKAEIEAARLEAIRNDPSLTAARYDEIIALRMLLLDVVDTIKEWDLFPDTERRRDHLERRITNRAETWGKDGDCA